MLKSVRFTKQKDITLNCSVKSFKVKLCLGVTSPISCMSHGHTNQIFTTDFVSDEMFVQAVQSNLVHMQYTGNDLSIIR